MPRDATPLSAAAAQSTVGGGGGGGGGGGAGGWVTDGGGELGAPGGGTTGGVGFMLSGSAHADSSKIRNSHAFSCGDSAAVPQPVGNAEPLPLAATWMPVWTNRPHCSAGVAARSTGIGTLK